MEEDGVLLPTIKQELKRKMDITFAPLGAKQVMIQINQKMENGNVDQKQY